MSFAQPAPLEPQVPEEDRRHPALTYLATLSPQSRKSMRYSMDVVAAEVTGGTASALTCPWHQLRHEHSCWIRTRLIARYSPASVNRHLAALRGVLKQCVRLGLITAEDYFRATDFADVRLEKKKRVVSAEDIFRLFATLDEDPSPLAARDAALLAVLYGAGLKRSEAIALEYADVDGRALLVRGEGPQKRTVPLSDAVHDRLEAWVKLRGRHDGPMFCPRGGHGKFRYGGLTGQAVVRICLRRADAAGIEPVSPNDLRQRFISDLAAVGGSMAGVNRVAGRTRRVPC